MRSPKWWCVLVILICVAAGPVAFGQSTNPSDDATQSKSTGKAATEEEVQQLRREVAELKAQIQRLVEASAVAQGGAGRYSGGHRRPPERDRRPSKEGQRRSCGNRRMERRALFPEEFRR